MSSTKQTIRIVRHGNREDFLDPGWVKRAERPHDPGLSEDGLQQAREVGLGLVGRGVDRIYASPYQRTIQTASQIAQALDLPIRLEAGIGESLPHLKSTPEIIDAEAHQERFPRVDHAYESIHQPTFPESDREAHRRTGETIQRLADQHPDESLLFVSHASPIAGAVRHLLGSSERIRVPLCAIFTLERAVDAQEWTLVELADVSHLSNQEMSLRYAHLG